jgi:fluoride ion exporter CrcB/FEX
MPERIVLIAVGGGIGSVLRFITSVGAARWPGGSVQASQTGRSSST